MPNNDLLDAARTNARLGLRLREHCQCGGQRSSLEAAAVLTTGADVDPQTLLSAHREPTPPGMAAGPAFMHEGRKYTPSDVKRLLSGGDEGLAWAAQQLFPLPAPEPEYIQVVTQAPAPTKSVVEEFTDRLAEADRRTADQINGILTQALMTAVRRAGFKIRGKVTSAGAKQAMDEAPMGHAVAILSPGVFAALNMTELDALKNTFAELPETLGPILKANEAETIAAIAALFGISRPDAENLIGPGREAAREEALAFAVAQMTDLAASRLLIPEPHFPDGEQPINASAPPASIARTIALVAGGAALATESGRIALTPEGRPASAADPASAAGGSSRGPAAGDITARTLRSEVVRNRVGRQRVAELSAQAAAMSDDLASGLLFEADQILAGLPQGEPWSIASQIEESYVWTTGIPAVPFKPHQDLDGQRRPAFGPRPDTHKAISADFPGVEFYYPGDHKGCQCDELWSVVFRPENVDG